MKKIVALVLAMAMVLGLGTTAFAAKMGVLYAGAKGDAGWDYTVTLDDAEDAKDETFATYEIEAVAKKDGAEAWWATLSDVVEKGDDETVEYAGYDTFVKVADENFGDTTVVLVDGKAITYFLPIDEMEWDAKAIKVTLPVRPLDDKDMKCNTLYAVDAANTTYYYYDYALYKSSAAGDTILNVDGVAVNTVKTDLTDDVADGYFNSGHDYQVQRSNVTHKTTGFPTVTKVYCDDCGAEFKFVQGVDEVANVVFGDDNYMPVMVWNAASQTYVEQDVANGATFLFMELVTPAVPGISAGTSAPAVDGETVTSPKTFDAGIAMYVGMSVMAAAGSAVVLKKKD